MTPHPQVRQSGATPRAPIPNDFSLPLLSQETRGLGRPRFPSLCFFLTAVSVPPSLLRRSPFIPIMEGQSRRPAMTIHAFRLEEAGFTRSQVEALAEFMEGQAATKADLEGMEHRLETKITGVRGDLDAVEHRLESKINGVRGDLDAVEHRLETKINGVKTDLEAKINGVKTDLETKIAEAKAELKAEIAPLKTETVVVRWILGVVLTLQVATFIKLMVA
ncbi:BdrR [Pararhodospirillum photometricum DSM 122]|uniref:BdrR n=1 Tax=Pararhodospirillum photometricum DSM 122 TaxID=1150469 RepID=H6SLC9_PARPM|nr:BdrR [Pararhodospirillum photometricum DSM 122]